MAKESKYILIEEEALRDLLRTYYQQSYSVMLLSYVCYRNKVDTLFSMAEAGGVLYLSPRQLNEARDRCQLRAVNCGRFKLYSIYDLAMLAANLHRKRVLPNMKNLPNVMASIKPQQ